MSHGTKTPRRRLSVGWIVALLLLGLSLPIIALGISVPILGDRRWKRLEEECRSQASEVGARDPHRPVLRGDPIPGDAGEDYARALEWMTASGLLFGDPDSADYLKEADRETMQVWLEKRLPVLEIALRGTLRPEYRNQRYWEEKTPSYYRLWQLTPLGICRSRQLVEQGNVQTAVELLLDLVRINGDLSRGKSWFQSYTFMGQQTRCFTELKSLMATGVVDAEELRGIARDLDVLEADLPRFGEGMLLAAMDIGFQVLKAESIEELLKDSLYGGKSIPLWRRGILGRLTMLNWYEGQRAMARRIAAGDAKGWAEASLANQGACAELIAGRNYIVEFWSGPKAKLDFIPVHKVFRDGLAQLRLVRAAALYLADGALPDAEDPYGGKLRWSKKGHVFRLWSRGVDGVDDGGSGGWNPKSSRDIVLEVRR